MHRRVVAVLSFALLGGVLGSLVPAQSVSLVKDIETAAAPNPGSLPFGFVQRGAYVYFSADTTATGRELFRSDGTAAGTELVADLNPGAPGSWPDTLFATDDLVFFSCDDGVHGRELWRTDGTAAGTYLLRDLHAGPTSSGAAVVARIGGTVLFTATDPNTGTELYKTDGTAAGTVLVRDLNASGSASPRHFAELGSKAYFVADDGSDAVRLWVTDGTHDGTIPAATIATGSGSVAPSELVVVGSSIFFDAGTAAHGVELWVSDGTQSGTHLVRDLLTGSTGSMPRALTAVDDRLYFVARNSVATNEELWSSDGTEAGTYLVKEIAAGAVGSDPSDLAALGKQLLFAANDGVHGRELWRSDGTAPGTQLVKDIWPGETGALEHPYERTALIVIGGRAYFAAYAPGLGRELYGSDGTELGTGLVRDISPGEGNGMTALLGVHATQLVFAATATGVPGTEELWKSDGTEPGTVLVRDLNPPLPGTRSADPRDFFDADGTLYFQARTEATGVELWSSDGTEADTRRVADVWPGTSSSMASPRAWWRNTLYFAADDGTHGTELWASHGSAKTTALLADLVPGPESGRPGNFLAIGGFLYFDAADALWRTDGTAFGTTRVRAIEPGPLVRLHNTILCSGADREHGRELWKSDGTSQGTVLVKDIQAGGGGSNPTIPVVAGDYAYFVATTAQSTRELWRTAGTESGTLRLLEFGPVPVTTNATAVGDVLFFRGADGELWKSDGTVPGTMLVKDLWPGPQASNPHGLVALDGLLLFRADGPTGGCLWRSDGTEAGTTCVMPIHFDYGMRVGRRKVYFTATISLGSELWVTDGTVNGTTLVIDLNPGPGSSDPWYVALSGGMVFVGAEDGFHGRELFRFFPGATSQVLGDGCSARPRLPHLDATDPILGQDLRIEARDAPDAAVAMLLLGNRAGVLAELAPGCFSYVDLWAPLFVVDAFVTTISDWSRTLNVPADTKLLGQHFATQAWYVSPAGVEATNGVALTLGS
ncbi:MAG: hypothetical protein H6833_00160 [Planctomycetes bacterium]|nr:hypothetical protein [Planctomycetota bacterium]